MGPKISEIADEIRMIYKSDTLKAETLIETYMEQKVKECLPGERLAFLEKLTHQFESFSPKIKPDHGFEQKEFSQLFSMLLGERNSKVDLSSTEHLEKLAHSLNTVFDTLNQIISVIHTTLLGKKAELETIRQIIGSDLEGEGRSDSLQSYLDQILKAFLVAHQAFQQAARTNISRILDELDPDRISAMTEGGLKFGAFRKAELFEIYKEKFYAIKSWSESGRLAEELLREFEKICQKLYKMETRGAK